MITLVHDGATGDRCSESAGAGTHARMLDDPHVGDNARRLALMLDSRPA